MTRDQYNRELESDSYDKNALYLTPDETPKITVDEVQGGHKITISDAEDSQSFDVLDGKTPVKGVDYWTEQEKNELIAETRREYYYNSVAAALTDINNNTWANGLTNAVGASVMTCIDELGQVTLALLQDVTETSFMYVKKNTHLALGEYKINITNVDTCLLFYPNTNCKITATTGGIIKNTTGAPQGGASFIQTYGELHINGGVYSLTANPSTDAIIFAIMSTSASKLLELNKCKITVTNPRITDAKDTRVIEAQGQELQINNSRLSVASYGPAWAVVQWGNQISVMDSTILAVSDAWNAKGIFTKDAVAKVLIENSTISATTKSDITTGSDGPAADGLTVGSASTVSNIKNSRIFADAKGANVTAGAFAVGISNVGIMHLKNVDVLGTHSGCNSSGKLHVSGGTFCGFCHGGFYIVRNEDGGEAFINDALIKCGNYNQVLDEDGETVLFGHFVDKYATEEMLGKIYAATYVGYDNNTAYFDGCTFDHAGVHFCVVLRGSSGEQNITVNISNSTIGDDGWIRVDNETHTLNVGVGTDITADKIRDKNGTSQPGWVVFTNKLYRKSSSEDVAVLHNYSDNQYIAKPAAASVGQTIVVKAVDENGKPTEWETANRLRHNPFGDDWGEPIVTVITEEEVSQIGIYDAAYYKEVLVSFTPAYSSTATSESVGGYAWIGGAFGGGLNVASPLTWLRATTNNANRSYSSLWYACILGEEIGVGRGKHCNKYCVLYTDEGVSNMSNYIGISETTTIGSIGFRVDDGQYFGIGTKIIVWGRK